MKKMKRSKPKLRPSQTSKCQADWSRTVIHERSDYRDNEQPNTDTSHDKKSYHHQFAVANLKDLQMASSKFEVESLNNSQSSILHHNNRQSITLSPDNNRTKYHRLSHWKPKSSESKKERTSSMIALLSIQIFIPIFIISLAVVKLNVINCIQTQQQQIRNQTPSEWFAIKSQSMQSHQQQRLYQRQVSAQNEAHERTRLKGEQTTPTAETAGGDSADSASKPHNPVQVQASLALNRRNDNYFDLISSRTDDIASSGGSYSSSPHSLDVDDGHQQKKSYPSSGISSFSTTSNNNEDLSADDSAAASTGSGSIHNFGSNSPVNDLMTQTAAAVAADGGSGGNWRVKAATNAKGNGSSQQTITWWTEGEKKPPTVEQEQDLSSELVGQHNYLQFGIDHSEATTDYQRTGGNGAASAGNKSTAIDTPKDRADDDTSKHELVDFLPPPPAGEPEFAESPASVVIDSEMQSDDAGGSLAQSDSKQTSPPPEVTSNLLPQIGNSLSHDSIGQFRPFDGLVPIVGPVVRSQQRVVVAQQQQTNEFRPSMNDQISVSATRAPNTWVEYLNNHRHLNSTPYLVAPASVAPSPKTTTTTTTTTTSTTTTTPAPKPPPTTSATNYPETTTTLSATTTKKLSQNDIYESWGRRVPKGEQQTTTGPSTVTTTSRRPSMTVSDEQSSMVTPQVMQTTSASPALTAASSSIYEDIITWTPAAGPAAYRSSFDQQPATMTTSMPSRFHAAVSPFAAQQDKLQQLKMQIRKQQAKQEPKVYASEYLASETGVQRQHIKAANINLYATRRPTTTSSTTSADPFAITGADEFGDQQQQSIDRQSIEPMTTGRSDSGDEDPDDDSDSDMDIMSESSTTETPTITTTAETLASVAPTGRPKAPPVNLKASDFGRELNHLSDEFAMLDDEQQRREVPAKGTKAQPGNNVMRKQTANDTKQTNDISWNAVPQAQPYHPVATNSKPNNQQEPAIIMGAPATKVEQQQQRQQVNTWNRQPHQTQNQLAPMIEKQPMQLQNKSLPVNNRQVVLPIQPQVQPQMQYSPMLLAPSNQRFVPVANPQPHWSITAFPYPQPAQNPMSYFSLFQQPSNHHQHLMLAGGIHHHIHHHQQQQQQKQQQQQQQIQRQASVNNGHPQVRPPPQMTGDWSNVSSEKLASPSSQRSQQRPTSAANQLPVPTNSTGNHQQVTKPEDSLQRSARGDMSASSRQQPPVTVYASSGGVQAKPPLTLNLRTASQSQVVGPNQLFWEAAAREAAHLHRHNKMFMEPSAGFGPATGKVPLISNAPLSNQRQLPANFAAAASHTNGHAYPAPSLHHPFGGHEFANYGNANLLAQMSAFVPPLEPSDGLGFMAAMPISSFAAPPPQAAVAAGAGRPATAQSNHNQFVKKGQAVISAALPLASPATVHDPFGWPMGYGSEAAKSLLKVNHVAPPPAHLIPAKIAAAQSSALLYPTIIDTKHGSSVPIKEDPSTILNSQMPPAASALDEATDELRHWPSDPHSLQASHSMVRPFVWPAGADAMMAASEGHKATQANVVQVTLSTRPPAVPKQRFRLWQRLRLFQRGTGSGASSRNSTSTSDSDGPTTSGDSKKGKRRHKRGIVDSWHQFVNALSSRQPEKSPVNYAHNNIHKPATSDLDTSASNRHPPLRSVSSFIPLVDSDTRLAQDIESSILAQALLLNSQTSSQRHKQQQHPDYPFKEPPGSLVYSSTQVPNVINDLMSGASSTLVASHTQPANDSASSARQKPAQVTQRPIASGNTNLASSLDSGNLNSMVYVPMVEPTLEPPVNLPGALLINKQPSPRDRLLEISKNLLKSSRNPLTKLKQMTTNIRPVMQMMNSSGSHVQLPHSKLQHTLANPMSSGSQQSLSIAQRLNHIISPGVMINSVNPGNSLANFEQLTQPLKQWYQQNLLLASSGHQQAQSAKPNQLGSTLMPLAAHTSQHLSPYSLIVDSPQQQSMRQAIPLRYHSHSKRAPNQNNSSLPLFRIPFNHRNSPAFEQLITSPNRQSFLLPKRLLDLHKKLVGDVQHAQRSDREAIATQVDRYKLSLQPFNKVMRLSSGTGLNETAGRQQPAAPSSSKLRPPTRLKKPHPKSNTAEASDYQAPAASLRRSGREFDYSQIVDTDDEQMMSNVSSRPQVMQSFSIPSAQRRSQLSQWPLRQTIRLLNGAGHFQQQQQQHQQQAFMQQQKPFLSGFDPSSSSAEHRELMTGARDNFSRFQLGSSHQQSTANDTAQVFQHPGADPTEIYSSPSSQQPVEITSEMASAVAAAAQAGADVSSLEEAAGLMAGGSGDASNADPAQSSPPADELALAQMAAAEAAAAAGGGAGSEAAAFEQSYQVADPKTDGGVSSAPASIEDQLAAVSPSNSDYLNPQQQHQQFHNQQQQQLLNSQQSTHQIQQHQPQQQMQQVTQWPQRPGASMSMSPGMQIGAQQMSGLPQTMMAASNLQQQSVLASVGALQRPRLPKFIPSINSMASKFRQHLFQTFKLANPSRWPMLAASSSPFPLKHLSNVLPHNSMLPLNFRPQHPMPIHQLPQQMQQSQPQVSQQQQPQQQQQQPQHFNNIQAASHQHQVNRPMDQEAMAASYYNFGNPPTLDLMGNSKQQANTLHFTDQPQQQVNFMAMGQQQHQRQQTTGGKQHYPPASSNQQQQAASSFGQPQMIHHHHSQQSQLDNQLPHVDSSQQVAGASLISEDGQIVYTDKLLAHQVVEPQNQLVQQHLSPADQATLQEYVAQQQQQQGSNSSLGSEAHSSQETYEQQQQQASPGVGNGNANAGTGTGTGQSLGDGQQLIVVNGTQNQEIVSQGQHEHHHHVVITDISGNLLTSDGTYIQEDPSGNQVNANQQTPIEQQQQQQFHIAENSRLPHHHPYSPMQQAVGQQQQQPDEAKEPQASDVSVYNMSALIQQQQQLADTNSVEEQQAVVVDQQQQQQVDPQSAAPELAGFANAQIQYDQVGNPSIVATRSANGSVFMQPAAQRQPAPATMQQRKKLIPQTLTGLKRLKSPPRVVQQTANKGRQITQEIGQLADSADYQIIKASNQVESQLRLVNGTLDQTHVFHLIPSGQQATQESQSTGNQQQQLVESTEDVEEQQVAVIAPQQQQHQSHQQPAQETGQQVLVFGEQQPLSPNTGDSSVDSSVVVYRENGTMSQQHRPALGGKHIIARPRVIHHHHHQVQQVQSVASSAPQDGVLYEFNVAANGGGSNEVSPSVDSSSMAINMTQQSNGEQEFVGSIPAASAATGTIIGNGAGGRLTMRQRPALMAGRQRISGGSHDFARLNMDAQSNGTGLMPQTGGSLPPPLPTIQSQQDSHDPSASVSSSAHEQYILLEQSAGANGEPTGNQTWNSTSGDQPAVFVKPARVQHQQQSTQMTKQEQQMHKQMHEQLRRHPLKSPKSAQQAKIRWKVQQQHQQQQQQQLGETSRHNSSLAMLAAAASAIEQTVSSSSINGTNQVYASKPRSPANRKQQATIAPALVLARDSFTRPPKAKIRWQGAGGANRTHAQIQVQNTTSTSDQATESSQSSAWSSSDPLNLPSSSRLMQSSASYHQMNDTTAGGEMSASNITVPQKIYTNHRASSNSSYLQHVSEPIRSSSNYTFSSSSSSPPADSDASTTTARNYSHHGIQQQSRKHHAEPMVSQVRGRFQTFSRPVASAERKATTSSSATTTTTTTTTAAPSGQRRDSRTGSTSFRLSTGPATSEQSQQQVSATSQAPTLVAPETAERQQPTPPALSRANTTSATSTSADPIVRPTVFSDAKSPTNNSTSVAQSLAAQQQQNPNELESPTFGGPSVSVNYTSAAISYHNHQLDGPGGAELSAQTQAAATTTVDSYSLDLDAAAIRSHESDDHLATDSAASGKLGASDWTRTNSLLVSGLDSPGGSLLATDSHSKD